MSEQPLSAETPDARDRRITVALVWGAACHGVFALAGAAMVLAMWFGMSRSLGPVPPPWSWVANAVLIAQFPLAHSLLLTARGQRLLARLAPAPYGATLATTTYAAVAAAQLLLLFAFWSPSGVIWWRAEGWALVALTAAYAASWAFLAKASFDAGAAVQSGLLGWWALVRGVKPVFPDMPTRGLFRLVRQPIYLGFALTLWTVPTWTPDQLALASLFTAYCALAPLHKERRFARRYGARFAEYRARTPYWLPLPRRRGVSPPPPPAARSPTPASRA
ncbi:MAG: isoprenylcysteine carboxylmethyltransferase family protein [Rhodobacteraceae bacterium]|nr:MAG: isoprenylcysteine carboxylmethyltransferase family protein [Paracoccaceae bacterium]